MRWMRRRGARNQVRYEPPPFDDGSSQEQGVFDAAPTNERSSFDDHGARAELPFEHPTAAEWFDGHGLHEEPPLTGDQGGLEQPFDQPAAGEEWPALAPDLPDSRASLDEDAPQAELRFDNRAERPLPTGDRTLRERSSFEAPAAQSPPFEGHAADEQYFERGWDEDSPPALPEASRVRAPRWSGGTQRRRWHLAALALAPIVVLVAGFGLGILSGAQEFDRLLTTLGWRSLADGSVAAALRDLAQPDPAPPSTTSAQSSISGAAPPSTSPAQSAGDGAEPPVEPAPSPQLSELQTVRVAPLPAPPKVEEAPDPVTSDMPLPPPPKPAPWSSLSGEERASGSDRIESAADVAAVPVLAADGAVDDGVEDAAVPGLATDGAVDDGSKTLPFLGSRSTTRSKTLPWQCSSPMAQAVRSSRFSSRLQFLNPGFSSTTPRAPPAARPPPCTSSGASGRQVSLSRGERSSFRFQRTAFATSSMAIVTKRKP